MSQTTAKERLIDAAERLVAECGLSSMTLSRVQEEAGQANRSAARYHFGSREGLIAGVVESRMKDVDNERRIMLKNMDIDGTGSDSRALVRALVMPLVDNTIRNPQSRYARFIAQVMLDPGLTEITRGHSRAGSFREVCARLVAVSHLPKPTVEWRVDGVVALTFVTLAASEARGSDPDIIGAELVDACLALMEVTGAEQ